ncbi:MAG: hypothetical protein AAGF76_01140 [Pseudomonadota bacterium]
MDEVGRLKEANGRYEFSFDELNLVVRGSQVEWVLEAATEIIREVAKMDLAGRMDELHALIEMGEADTIDLDIVEEDTKSRFELMPQCFVTMGDTDYRWTAPEGRGDPEGGAARQLFERLVDMSLTRNDTFLKNVDGAFDRSPKE